MHSRKALTPETLNQLFIQARTHHAWQNKVVSQELLHQLYNVLKWGPTSLNSSPARIVFITTEKAKKRLLPHLTGSNVEQVWSAPVTAIIAQDMNFYEHLPYLAPHTKDARSWFAGQSEMIQVTAFRNSSLQGAYLILAARALGLDAGPMSGFDNEGVDKEFFPNKPWKSNFICALGYGEDSKLYPRAPRLDFQEACEIL